MDKYKIQFIYEEENDINNIFIKVLKKQLNNYMEMVFSGGKGETSLDDVTLFEDNKEKQF